MRFTPEPINYDPYFVANTGEYCTARYGFKSSLPNDDNCAELKMQMCNEDKIILCVTHKQEYPHRVYQPRDVLGITDTLSRIHKREKNTADYSVKPAKPAVDKQKTPKRKKHSSSSSSTAPQICRTAKGYLVKGVEGTVDLYNGEAISKKTVNMETGEVFPEKFRGLKSLHESYRRMEDKVLFALKPKKTVFVSLNFDKRYTFDEIIKVAANLQKKYIKRYYCGAVGILVLQPCKIGSWHIHFLLCYNGFYHKKQVDKFKRGLQDWGKKYNGKQSDKMLDVQRLDDFRQIMIRWSYLDPYHHRDRAIYYPAGRQVFKQLGKLEEPPKPLLTTNSVINEFIKKIEACELTDFNQEKIFTDSEGYHLRTIDYSYYIISLKALKDIYANSICKPSPWKTDWQEPEQLCFFAPIVHRLSSDEIYCPL